MSASYHGIDHQSGTGMTSPYGTHHQYPHLSAQMTSYAPSQTPYRFPTNSDYSYTGSRYPVDHQSASFAALPSMTHLTYKRHPYRQHHGHQFHHGGHHYNLVGHHHSGHHSMTGMPYFPSFPMHHGFSHGFSHNAMVLAKNRRTMFLAIFKATLKLYVQLGIGLSVMLGTLYAFFGTAFAKVVQHFFHALGSTFLHLASINVKQSAIKKAV